MKYTKLNNSIQEVSGCTTCPHMTVETENGKKFMRCVMKIKLDGERFSHRRKKLIGSWTGAYHESCPLPSKSDGHFQEVVK